MTSLLQMIKKKPIISILFFLQNNIFLLTEINSNILNLILYISDARRSSFDFEIEVF